MIEGFNAQKRSINKPFRMPVQECFKIGGIGTVVCGRIETGLLQSQVPLKLFPSGKTTESKSIETNYTNGMNVIDTEGVMPGQLVGLNLKGVAKYEVKNGRNMIVYRQDEAPVEDTALFTA